MQIEIAREMMASYDSVRPHWLLTMWTAGRGIFTLLAIIDFASSATWLAIERRSAEEWAAGILRTIIRIGMFYTLLVYGADWAADVILTFQELGQRGSGLAGGISPDQIIARGLNIMWGSLNAASAWGILTNPAALITHIVSSMVAGLSFVLIAISYVVLMVEGYACLLAGYIFLAFGGSRWTAPYVERYIALVVSIGVKYLLFYFLIATGMAISATWAASMAAIPASGTPGMSAFAVMSQSLTFFLLCWQIPKLFAAMLGGSPALTAGDMLSASIATVSAAIAAPFVAGAVAGAVGGGAISAGKSIAAAAGFGGGGSSAGALAPYVPPPSRGSGSSGAPGGGSGGHSGYHVPPPGKSGGGGSSAGRWAGRAARMPSDHAGAPSPPRLNLDGEKE